MPTKKGKGRIASVDFGLARIGLAISDETKCIANTLGAIKAVKKQSQNALNVLEALSSYNLEKIVVGYPLKLNGKVGLMADEVNHFVEELKKVASCPIALIDERLSTLLAERILREANLNRKKRQKVIDGVTASILLQNFLETLAFNL